MSTVCEYTSMNMLRKFPSVRQQYEIFLPVEGMNTHKEFNLTIHFLGSRWISMFIWQKNTIFYDSICKIVRFIVLITVFFTLRLFKTPNLINKTWKQQNPRKILYSFCTVLHISRYPTVYAIRISIQFTHQMWSFVYRVQQQRCRTTCDKNKSFMTQYFLLNSITVYCNKAIKGCLSQV